MALLDYLFPPQDNQLGGLLGMDDERLRKQAQQAGLLNMGLGIISASGPSRMPQGLLQPVATGIMAGQQAYQGTMDQQMQQAAARQKLEREANFRKAIGGAFSMSPSAEGIRQTQTNIDPGLLEGMSAQQVIAAAPKTERVLDENKFMSALAEYNPLEFAKMQATAQKDTSPSKIKEFAAFQAMPKEQQQAYLQLQALLNPPSQTTFVDKGPNELRQLDAKEISALSGKVNSAREFANTAGAIQNLLTGLGGGKPVEVGAELAKFLGISSKTADASALATALQTRAATQVRAAGSGSTSDLEFKSFLSVFPSLGNSENGRALMAKGLRAFAERDALIEKKARELFEKNQYSAGALAAYDASLGPVIDPAEINRFRSGGGTPATQRKDFRQKDQ